MSMKKMLAVVAAASLMAAPAFAANPFSDVPMNHWAYDAVEQLSAKGILEGYPNGTFKGNRAMTRYEIATMVARMMANGGVGGADAEKLKALIVEFAPELEALGVKVDGFDGRLSKLEKGLGGLRVTGDMRFDYFNHTNRDNSNAMANTGDTGWKGNGWGFNRGRILMQKDMSEKVSWNMRYSGGQIDRYWITAKDFFGMNGLNFKAGQFYVDYESRDGLYENNIYWDDDSNFLSGNIRGFELTYNRGGLEFDAVVDSGATAATEDGVYGKNPGNESYAARIAYNGAKFRASANGVWNNNGDDNWNVYWFMLGFKPLKGFDLTAAYYMNDLSSDFALAKTASCDDAKMWKLVLSIDESVLKFTGLRLEYAKYDSGFYFSNGNNGSWQNSYDKGHAGAMADDTSWLKVSAVQKWTKKFSTFERFTQWDQDNNGKAKELQVGIGYQYSPNLGFVVDYAHLDGTLDGGKVDVTKEDKIVRFRTVLTF